MRGNGSTVNALPAAIGCLGLLLIAGCGDGHLHDRDHGSSAHDAADHRSEGKPLPSQSVTAWTDHTELFMEYPPLIVGRESAFAAHLTAIPSFKAVTQGSVSVLLTVAGADPLTARVDQPSSPGIFRPTLRPSRAAACRLTVLVDRDGMRDEIEAGACTVFADEEAARTALGNEAEPPGRITFLKEQQWSTDFATVAVQRRELRTSVTAAGTILPAAGKDTRVVAPAAGRVTFGATPPMLGAAVQKGDALAFFTPRLTDGDRASLEAELQSARAEASASETQLARVRGLFSEQAIARRAVEEAEARATTARARLQAAGARVEQYDTGLAGSTGRARGAFELSAPIDGTLVAVEIASGEAVESGQLLFRVIDLSTVWIEARVFEPDIPQLQGAQSGWFEVEGYDQPFTFGPGNSRPITVGQVVDSRTRTVPAIFAIDNADARLRIGQFARVSIATGSAAQALALPESALVDDAGREIAYVQVEGEAFERRPLTTGIRDMGFVEIVAGVAAGEHVVSKGAYEIKLAAASGVIPAHGHAH